MIGLIAHNALLVSLAAVAFGAVLTPVAIRTNRRDWLELVYGAVYANFLLVSIAAGSMVVALVTHDFSVSYVAQVGSRSTPLLFTVISLWGALEGSILFWAWV
ncbi:MAG: heme lyase CcmF/NrfE family subunit, partial [Gemmatimonadaceae bacterium]